MIVRCGSGLPWNAKYPGTPYWPWSPAIGRAEDVQPDQDRFVGEDVVVTEKLDGGNTLLHAGKVYARSVSAPSEGKWMAMVKFYSSFHSMNKVEKGKEEKKVEENKQQEEEEDES